MEATLLALVAATSFAASGILARVGAQGVRPSTGTAVSVVSSLGLAIIPALALDLPAFAEIPLAGFLWMALLAFINYPLARLLNFTSISKIGAARAAPLASSAPLWSAVLAVLFLGERPNAIIILGTLSIVAGVVLIMSERSTGGTATDQAGAGQAAAEG